MKTLSLTQPWASLVVLGAKQWETRSWNTSYRGPLAIQAAKSFPRACRDLCNAQPFWMALWGRAPDDEHIRCLPRGKVLGTAELVDVRSTSRANVSPVEELFGDYSEGRFAWKLEGGARFHTPIPAKGSLGLWNWEPPKKFAEAVSDRHTPLHPLLGQHALGPLSGRAYAVDWPPGLPKRGRCRKTGAVEGPAGPHDYLVGVGSLGIDDWACLYKDGVRVFDCNGMYFRTHFEVLEPEAQAS